MPDPPATLPPRFLLEGRVVTMRRPAPGQPSVITDGVVGIEGNTIRHVAERSAPLPAAFDDAPRIRTGDSIYPGLIDLHNHLAYNAMPLWEVPRRFLNPSGWQQPEAYRSRITKPTRTLGLSQLVPGEEDVLPAMIRYVECRSLFGGTTSSQGVTLSGVGNLLTQFQGLVRNVEQPLDPRLPAAEARISDPQPGKAADLKQTLEALQGAFLQHLSEGAPGNETARKPFLDLRIAGDDWAITPRFAGIHCGALRAEDLALLGAKGGTLVWSPLSNYLLYGQTTDIAAAKAAGLTIGLGCDWAPSGSKSLLGEMKVAWLAGQIEAGPGQDPLFSMEEIARMATLDAARILGWEPWLGSIEVGKLADLVLLNGQQGDDYQRLIEARETRITLVLLDGVPRLGQPKLMRDLGLGAVAEELHIGGSRRLLHLGAATAPIDLAAAGMSYAKARDTLSDAMARLPQIAAQIEALAASGQGLFFGDAAAGAGDGRFRLVLDLEESADWTAGDLARAAEDLTQYVQPMALEGITVADDASHLLKLAFSTNPPQAIKEGLPPLFGQAYREPVSSPFGAGFTPDPGAPDAVRASSDLASFRLQSGRLSLQDRQTLVLQARLLLEEHYVHLPFKRAMHAVDPLQQLRLLAYRIEREAEAGELGPELDFHAELGGIFKGLRDLHTSYRLPLPYRGHTAWLPYLIEACHEGGQRRYLVSATVGDPGPESFKSGVEALHWNGMPIERAIAQNADRYAGSNAEARFARGLKALTTRPLGAGPPPDEDWVTLHYRYRLPDGPDGQPRHAEQEYRQRWMVLQPGQSPASIRTDEIDTETIDPGMLLGLGLDAAMDDVQEARRLLYAPALAAEEARRAPKAGRPRRLRASRAELSTSLPTALKARVIPRGPAQQPAGYLRIYTFNVNDPDFFVQEVARLLGQLPQEGLILDVRGNGGGHIYAAEQLLQLFTPRPIRPEPAQLINTPANLQLARRHSPSRHLPDLDLQPWLRSLSQSVQTGATFSSAASITPPERCNHIRQRYYGPCVLITDALCYSATDIFTAGFQDHEIGRVLGVDGNTGAGGANVWTHALIRFLMSDLEADGGAPNPRYAPLPAGADLRIAMRRTLRVGAENANEVVEDLGIVPDALHGTTRDDLLHGNRDLIAAALRLLEDRPAHTIRLEAIPDPEGLPLLQVETRNLTLLALLIDNGHPELIPTEDGVLQIDLGDFGPVPADATFPVDLLGFAAEDPHEPAACRRVWIQTDASGRGVPIEEWSAEP